MRSGDWAFYGVFLDQQLISVVSLFIHRTAESAGYVPHSIDFEFLGGSDGLGYLQPVVYYMKVYDYGPIMPRGSMVLTEAVRELSAQCRALR